mmetsp:Transcript_13410/g.49834  ORF Transcript_13410/g.49834 Transcript_13410/m.49834 type:complete len:614 (+) Transcript_13410:485-2326(+)
MAGEAVAQEVARQAGLADDGMHILLVHRVHVAEAVHLPATRHVRQAVQEASQEVRFHVVVEDSVERIRIVDDLALKPVRHGAEDQLLAGPPRHEVDAGGAMRIGDEREAEKILAVDGDVPDLDPRRKHGGARLDAAGVVELLEPRSKAVHYAARHDHAPVLQLHAGGLPAAREDLRHARLEAVVHAFPSHGVQHVLQAAAGVQVAAAVLVERRELRKDPPRLFPGFGIVLRIRIGVHRREHLLYTRRVEHGGVHTKGLQPLLHYLVLLASLAEHPEGSRLGEVRARLLDAGVRRPVLEGSNAIQRKLHGLVKAVEGPHESRGPPRRADAEGAASLQDDDAHAGITAFELIRDVQAHDATSADDDVGSLRSRCGEGASLVPRRRTECSANDVAPREGPRRLHCGDGRVEHTLPPWREAKTDGGGLVGRRLRQQVGHLRRGSLHLQVFCFLGQLGDLLGLAEDVLAAERVQLVRLGTLEGVLVVLLDAVHDHGARAGDAFGHEVDGRAPAWNGRLRDFLRLCVRKGEVRRANDVAAPDFSCHLHGDQAGLRAGHDGIDLELPPGLVALGDVDAAFDVCSVAKDVYGVDRGAHGGQLSGYDAAHGSAAVHEQLLPL